MLTLMELYNGGQTKPGIFSGLVPRFAEMPRLLCSFIHESHRVRRFTGLSRRFVIMMVMNLIVTLHDGDITV